MTQPPLDLRKDADARRALNDRLPGYGLTRASANERAAFVYAASRSPNVKQRPIPVVVVGALVAVPAFLIFAVELYGVLTTGAPTSLLLWASLAVGTVALYVCALAWELYDPIRALKTLLILLATVLVGIFVILLAIAALRGEDVDLDIFDLIPGGLEGSTATGGGSGATSSIRVTVDRPMANAVVDALDGAGEYLPDLLGEAGQPPPTVPRPEALRAEAGELGAAVAAASRWRWRVDGAEDAATEPPADAPAAQILATTCDGCGYQSAGQAWLNCPRCGRPALTA